MHYRCSCNSCSSISGSYSRYYLNFHVFIGNFQHNSCHTINSRITAAYKTDCFPLSCQFKHFCTSVHFLCHCGAFHLFSRIIFLHQIHISFIPYYYITVLHCFICPECHIFLFSRPYAHYINFSITHIFLAPLHKLKLLFRCILPSSQ